MELLHKFKRQGYFTAELYHLLSKKKLTETYDEIIPSEYEREMKMTTAERLQSLNNIFIENIVHSGSTCKIVLSFTPPLIIFQNFKPNEKIVAKFSVKNISKSPTYLNMVCKESSYFFVKPCGGQLLSRLAPGISVTFAVTFQPVQYEDYTHRVTFYTDLEQYVVPLIAMGPRPVFDFPNQIIVPKTPLKIENYSMLAIHNIGTVPAGFTLSTKCPFSVHPKSAYLSPNERIDVQVAFKTMHLGDTQGIMNATFETGENFRIKLFGSTYTVHIELEKYVVRFLDTFNTMARQQTFKIKNKSDHVLTYACMKNSCVYNDFEEKLKLATTFYDFKESEKAKCNKLVYYDVLSSDEHERVYTRIFIDEVHALVADEDLLFQYTHMSVTPDKGKLWPNKTTELTISFAPKAIGEFEAVVYLDVDGVYDRIPLKIVGTSLPPLITLNLETLEMDRVYINKTYNYKIIATNKGHINGLIVYKVVPPLFGSIISCDPQMLCLRPGDSDSFDISFLNSNQGPFFEEIHFIIRDTNVVIKLYLK